jgi:hypothetical protein
MTRRFRPDGLVNAKALLNKTMRLLGDRKAMDGSERKTI